jgi:hypothetical protein
MTLGMKGCISPVIFASGATMLPTLAHRLLTPIPVCLEGVRVGIGNLCVGLLKDGPGTSGLGAEGCHSPPGPVSFAWPPP